MPLSAYLPDPDKWIDTSAAPASRPKQRPLTAFRHGLATPPTTGSRPRHAQAFVPSATPSDSSGKPSHVGATSRNVGRHGLPTPPTGASQSRYRPVASRLRIANEASSGSPVPSSFTSEGGHAATRGQVGQSTKGRGRSNLALVWSSDDDTLTGSNAAAGPSRPRPSASRPSAPFKDGTARSGMRPVIDAFSSGELSDLPPEYSTDSDEPPPPPPRAAIPPSLKRPRPGDTRASGSRVSSQKQPKTPRDLQRDRHSGKDPDGYTPPEHSPRLLTQPPLRVLASHWRMNGLSSDRIGQGEEMWGKSRGWLENEQRRKDAEKRKIDEFEEMEERKRARVDRGKVDVEQRRRIGVQMDEHELDQLISRHEDDRVRRVKRILPGLDTDMPYEGSRSAALESSVSPEGKQVSRQRTQIGGRTPLSPIAANSHRRAMPAVSLPKTGPRLAAPHRAIPPVGVATGMSTDRVVASASELDDELQPNSIPVPTESASIDSSIAEILENARMDALQHCGHPSPIMPPPALGFAATPSSDNRAARKGQFKPVDVVETLMTWSLGKGGLANVPMAPAGAQSASGQVRPAPKPLQPKFIPEDSPSGSEVSDSNQKAGPAEEQSLAPTIPSQRYPHLLPSPDTSTSKRASKSGQGWAGLEEGILSIPAAPASDSKADETSRLPMSGAGPSRSKRKSEPTAGGRPVKNEGRSKGRDKGASATPKQTKLQAYGLLKDKVRKRPRGFSNDFADEDDLSEEDSGGGNEAAERSLLGTSSLMSRQPGLERVPDAPFHPDIRPAGLRAMKQSRTSVATAFPPPSAKVPPQAPKAVGESPSRPPIRPMLVPHASTQPLLPIDTPIPAFAAAPIHRSSSETEVDAPLFSPPSSPFRPLIPLGSHRGVCERAPWETSPGAASAVPVPAPSRVHTVTPTTPGGTDVSSSLVTSTTTEEGGWGLSEAAKAWWDRLG